MARSGAPPTGIHPEDIPQPTQDALFHTVGKGISLWQSVEIALSHVFARLLSPTPENVTRTLFYTPLDFDMKLSMTNHVARIVLSASLLREWQGKDRLRSRLRSAAQKRNCLAHFAASTVFTIYREPRNPGAPIQVHDGMIDFLITPNHQDPLEEFRNRKNDLQPPMNKADIENVINEFTRLREDLINFSQRIPQHTAPP